MCPSRVAFCSLGFVLHFFLHSLYDSMFSALFIFFFFNDTATTSIYTLSLHDALPILRFIENFVGTRLTEGVASQPVRVSGWSSLPPAGTPWISVKTRKEAESFIEIARAEDRKSTRLNSSHTVISYAVFCLKKKNKRHQRQPTLNRHAPRRTRMRHQHKPSFLF